jgi:outer membrane protein assembly factor BamB
MKAMRRYLTGLGVVGLVLGMGEGSPASDRWPQFRGEGASGVSRETRLPETWSTEANVAWSVAIPGRGWSSPVVWGDSVFLTSATSAGAFKEPTPGIYGNDYIAELSAQGLSDDEVRRRVRARDNETPEEAGGEVRWEVRALEVATGKTRWTTEVHRGRPFGGRHRKNTYASETPATDGERLYVLVGNVGTFALSLEGGRVLWRAPLPARPSYLDFGTASSPVVNEGQVIVLADNQEESFLASFDAKTGRERWRTRRDFGKAMVRSSFTTPFLWKNSRGTEIVTLSPQAIVSYDLEGRERWRLTGTSMVAAPTPVADGDLLFVGAGSPSENQRPLLAIRAGASGDITLEDGATTSAYVAWNQERGGPYITSPLLYEGRLYVLFDQGFFGAYDAQSGRQLYKVRFPDGAPTFSASPWAHGGRIFCLSEQGETFVIAAGDEWKLLGKNPLGEMSLATPALAHNSLFLRTAGRLYRLAGL